VLCALLPVLIFWVFGLYHAIFRYFDSDALLHTARALLSPQKTAQYTSPELLGILVSLVQAQGL